MRSRTLSKSEIADINSKLKERYNILPLNKKGIVQEIDNKGIKCLRVNGSILFFYKDGLLLPALRSIVQDNFLKKVTVDMGAVRFLCSGADLMRPGIVEIEDGITPGDIVSAVDINNRKPIMVGKAIYSSDEMRSQKGGKSVLNLHFVGDDIWNDA